MTISHKNPDKKNWTLTPYSAFNIFIIFIVVLAVVLTFTGYKSILLPPLVIYITIWIVAILGTGGRIFSSKPVVIGTHILSILFVTLIFINYSTFQKINEDIDVTNQIAHIEKTNAIKEVPTGLGFEIVPTTDETAIPDTDKFTDRQYYKIEFLDGSVEYILLLPVNNYKYGRRLLNIKDDNSNMVLESNKVCFEFFFSKECTTSFKIYHRREPDIAIISFTPKMFVAEHTISTLDLK